MIIAMQMRILDITRLFAFALFGRLQRRYKCILFVMGSWSVLGRPLGQSWHTENEWMQLCKISISVIQLVFYTIVDRFRIYKLSRTGRDSYRLFSKSPAIFQTYLLPVSVAQLIPFSSVAEASSPCPILIIQIAPKINPAKTTIRNMTITNEYIHLAAVFNKIKDI